MAARMERLAGSVMGARVGRGSNRGLDMAPILRRREPVDMQRRMVRAGLDSWTQAPHMGASTVNDARRAGGRRWMSVEGAESEEDQHEIMFYSLRHAATVTLKEMHHFGAQVQTLPTLRLARTPSSARPAPGLQR